MEQESQIGDSTYNSAEPSQLKYPLDPVTRRMVQEDSLVFRKTTGSSMYVSVNGVEYALTFGALVVVKTAIETITSSTTLHNDTELLLPVEASSRYAIEAYIGYTSSNADGIKFKFTVPSGTTMVWNDLSPDLAQTDSSGAYNHSTSTGLTSSMSVHGYLVVGSTAGNFQLQWAKENAGSDDTSVLEGSWIRLTKTS